MCLRARHRGALLGCCLTLALAPEAGAMQICAPEEYIGLPTGRYREEGGEVPDPYVHYYDSQGQLVDGVLGGFDIYHTYTLLPKGRMAVTYENEDQMILDTDTLQEVERLPGDRDLAMAYAQEAYALWDRETGEIRVCHRKGDVLAREYPAALSRLSEEGLKYLDLYAGDGFYFLQTYANGQVPYCMIVSQDGEVLSTEQAEFPLALRGGIYATFGSAVIIEDWEDHYQVRDLEGFLLADDVQPCISWDYSYARYDQNKAMHILIREGDWFRVLDPQWQSPGVLSEDMLSGRSVSYAAGEVVGLPSEKLAGAVCEGKTLWDGTEVPYGVLGDRYVVSAGDGIQLVQVPEGERLTAVTDGLVLTTAAEEYVWKVYRRSDLALLDTSESRIEIQKETYCVRVYDEETQETSYTIHDLQGEVLYHSSGRIEACGMDNYVIQRGPYLGIADRYGSWLIKELRFAE